MRCLPAVTSTARPPPVPWRVATGSPRAPQLVAACPAGSSSMGAWRTLVHPSALARGELRPAKRHQEGG
eukprot:15446156-Alexandrium_andersonii.AAC.1